MEKLEQHQVLFISKLMGADQVYDDINAWIKNAHSGRNITETHHKRLISLLKESLLENKIETEDINTIIKKAENFKPLIIED